MSNSSQTAVRGLALAELFSGASCSKTARKYGLAREELQRLAQDARRRRLWPAALFRQTQQTSVERSER